MISNSNENTGRLALVVVLACAVVACQSGCGRAASLPAPGAVGRPQANRKDSAGKLLLLTNGSQIKLFPLSTGPDSRQLSPSGAHYLLRSVDDAPFNATDPRLIATLGPSSAYVGWLEHRQRLTGPDQPNADTDRDRNSTEASILPGARQRRPKSWIASQSPLSDEGAKLYSGTWKRPSITSLGHFFDPRFCGELEAVSASVTQLRGCPVIYWLDSSNSFVHLGSLRLNGFTSDRDSSRRTDQHHQGSVRLNELPPIDLNFVKLGREDRTQIIRVTIDERQLELRVVISLDELGVSRLSVENVKLEPGFDLNGTLVSLVRSELGDNDDELAAEQQVDETLELVRASVVDRLLPVEAPLDLDLLTMGPRRLSPDGEKRDKHQSADRQLETAELLEEPVPLELIEEDGIASLPAGSHKAGSRPNDTLDAALAVAMDRASCDLFWINSNNELYSSKYDPDQYRDLGHDRMDDNASWLGAEFVGRLVTTRPLVRPPVIKMQSFQGTIFFIDSARRSLMAYELPSLATSIESSRNVERANFGVRGDLVPRLDSTHRVLLVEMSAIRDFDLVDLSERDEQWCPALNDRWIPMSSDISKLQSRHQEVVIPSERRVADIVPEGLKQARPSQLAMPEPITTTKLALDVLVEEVDANNNLDGWSPLLVSTPDDESGTRLISGESSGTQSGPSLVYQPVHHRSIVWHDTIHRWLSLSVLIVLLAGLVLVVSWMAAVYRLLLKRSSLNDLILVKEDQLEGGKSDNKEPSKA